MPKQSSRELVLERRKALSQGGKKAVAANSASSNRVRNASDARSTRTDNDVVKVAKARPESPSRSENTALKFSSEKSASSRQAKRVSQPGRELVLARREALSRRGKSADTSKDRTRRDAQKNSAKVENISSNKTSHCCAECESKDRDSSVAQKTLLKSSEGSQKLGAKHGGRGAAKKRSAIQNSSRALVLARREAQSKHGKTAAKQPTSAASVARQGDPDLSSREISQRVRELRSKSGAVGKQRSGATRPCGPNRKAAKQVAAADAHWKVGVSETTTGQLVTGTQANRSVKTTGNEASTCRSITGTEYLGSEVFETFCKSAPSSSQPPKVRVSATSHGNKVTGNEVGRSEKVTGDEPGTCKTLTGTEYISANQSNAFCGEVTPSPRKVGQSLSESGRKISGAMVGRSSNVTGDEAGSDRSLTGDQYLGSEPLPSGRSAEKVGSLNTLRGTGVTGTNVSRSGQVTGNEPGSCKAVTGDEYVDAQQYEGFCGQRPSPEAAKVGFSVTNKSQVVSGTTTGRSELVTGDEPGTCKAVTGTPYVGLDQAGQWCNTKAVKSIQARTPKQAGTPGAALTGQQPGIGGVMTGAERGACEALTGTPYIGGDQLNQTCGSSAPQANDHAVEGQDSAPWTHFSVQSPARAAHQRSQHNSGVTGTSYEQGARITGPFDRAEEKVTGTEQFRFDRRPRKVESAPAEVTVDEDARPVSRVTGEGNSAGLNITGDDWDRGERVTGTEGVSARRRNPSRPGQRSAIPASTQKRNDQVAKPVSRVTGASGNTDQGSLITVSGGARG
ncbi:MAG: CsoS2 family carboxysome shell protein [Prochlorococcus sp.]|nr:CsoS2 family carboxysome shell protein [Prochlorococcaceae cyanobacterium Fu_MAG_50]